MNFSGYSFTNSCYVSTQNEVANDLYDALMQFFQLFPSMKKNDFYVTGESYAGKYVPAISYKIHTENKMMIQNQKPRDVINLKVRIHVTRRHGDFYLQFYYYDKGDKKDKTTLFLHFS